MKPKDKEITLNVHHESVEYSRRSGYREDVELKIGVFFNDSSNPRIIAFEESYEGQFPVALAWSEITEFIAHARGEISQRRKDLLEGGTIPRNGSRGGKISPYTMRV
jgi:hypothetical protein